MRLFNRRRSSREGVVDGTVVDISSLQEADAHTPITVARAGGRLHRVTPGDSIPVEKLLILTELTLSNSEVVVREGVVLQKNDHVFPGELVFIEDFDDNG